MQEPPSQPTNPQPAPAPPPLPNQPQAAPQPDYWSQPRQVTPEDEARQRIIEANRQQLTMMIGGVLVVSFIGLFIAMNTKNEPKAGDAGKTGSAQTTSAPSQPVPGQVAPPPSVPAQPHVSKEVIDALVAKAQEKGLLKVTIGVHVDRPANATPEQLQAVADSLRTSEDAITMNAFGATVSPQVTRHEPMPEMTATADVEQIKKLGADPHVESLQEAP